MTRPLTALRTNRVVPTLLALGMMGVAAQAADPVFSAATVGTGTTATFSVEWTDEVNGWDPLFKQTTGLGVGGDFHVYTATAAAVTAGTIPDPSATSAQTGITPITLTNANIVSNNGHKTVFSVPMGTDVKLYAQIPANAAFIQSGSGTPTQFPAAAVPGAATATLLYTVVPATPTVQTNTIVAPANNTTTVSRTPSVTVNFNIDDNETNTSSQINTLFGTTEDFVIKITDSVSGGVVGSAVVHKTGVAYNNATPLAQRQNQLITLSEPLVAGAHTLTATIYDPLNHTAGATPTLKLVVWDDPTLVVDGVTPDGNTFQTSSAKDLVFTGTKFSIGAFTSSVSLTVDGVAATPVVVADPTKFKFTLPTLAAGASHAVVLTQTYTGTVVTGNPTLVKTFTLDNSTFIDTTPPDAPVIASPANFSTVVVTKPTITGQTEPNAKVNLRFTDETDAATTLAATVTADETGAFTFATGDWGASVLALNHTYRIQVMATDAAGNVGAWSPLEDFAVVTPAEAVKVAFTPNTPADITTVGGVNYTKLNTPIVFKVTPTKFDGTAYGAVAISDLATTDFTITNGTITGSLTTANALTVTVTPTAAGAVTIALPAAKFKISGIDNEAATSYVFVKDTAAPTLTTAIVGAASSTTAVGTACSVVITSNEALNAYDLAKVALVGTGTSTAGFSAVQGSASLSTDKKVLTVPYTITPGAATGVSLTLTAAAGTDLAGNTSAAVSTAVTKTLDTAAPTLVSLTSTQAAVGKVAPIIFVATFSEAVTGFDVGDFDITNGVVSAFAGTGPTYNLTVIPGEGPTPVKATIKTGTVVTDTVGRTLTTSGSVAGVNYLTRTYDSTPPRVLSLASSTAAPTSTDDKPTNRTSIPCSLVFSEAVTGLSAASFQVENGTISGLSGSGSVYTFNVNVSSPTTVSKKVRVVLLAGKVQDAVGNLNSSVAVLLRNYDGTLPTLDFATPTLANSGANDSKGTFVINVNNGGASDVLTTKFDKSKIQVLGGTVDSITSASSSGKLTSITVVVTLPRAAGNTVTVTAQPGVVTDVAGNKNALTTGLLTVPGAG